MWDGERGWACVYPAHPVAGGCPAPRRGSAPAFGLARPGFHFPWQKSKEVLPKPGLASPVGAGGTGGAGGADSRSRFQALVQPGPARYRRLRVSRRGSRLHPRLAIPARVTRWSLAPGMRVLASGETLWGRSPAPVCPRFLQRDWGEKSRVK